MEDHFSLSDMPALQILNQHLNNCGLSSVGRGQKVWQRNDAQLLITVGAEEISILIDGHSLYNWPDSTVIQSWRLSKQRLATLCFWRSLSGDLAAVAERLK